MNTPNKLKQYQRLLYAALNNKLGAMSNGACAYSSGTRRCSVGFMFSPEQLADIKRRDLNENTSISKLASVIGENNIEQVTGFTMDELEELQDEHDGSSHDLSNRKQKVRADSVFVKHLYKAISKELRK